MSDPRQEERLKAEELLRRRAVPTQLLERIERGLSPCDDELPFAQAVRQKEESEKAARSFAKQQRQREAKPDA